MRYLPARGRAGSICVEALEHFHDERRRERNRRQFFERRDRAGIRQARSHPYIEDRVQAVLLAIELATNHHRWSWVPR